MLPLAILSLIGQGIALAAKGVQSYQGAQNKKKQQRYSDEVYAKEKKEARQNAISRALGFEKKGEMMMPYIRSPQPGLIDSTGAQIAEGVGSSISAIDRYKQPDAYKYTPEQSNYLTEEGFKYDPAKNKYTWSR